MTRWRIVGAVLALLAVGVAALAFARARQVARSDRDWAADQARPARIVVDGDRVEIADARDFRHRPDGSWEERYLTYAFGLDEVTGVRLVVAPFAGRFRGLAHTFLSFELAGGRFLSVSVEARRERGEEYSLLGGLLRRFELIYVVGTEADLVGLRAVRGDSLYVYPTVASPPQARALLVDVLGRAEAVRREPEFYQTFTNNCTTNIRDHVNAVWPGRLPWGWGVLLPGHADALALEHGLLATDLPVEAARERFRVDDPPIPP